MYVSPGMCCWANGARRTIKWRMNTRRLLVRRVLTRCAQYHILVSLTKNAHDRVGTLRITKNDEKNDFCVKGFAAPGRRGVARFELQETKGLGKKGT